MGSVLERKLDFAIAYWVLSVCFVYMQKTSGLQKGRRKEEAAHKETS